MGTENLKFSFIFKIPEISLSFEGFDVDFAYTKSLGVFPDTAFFTVWNLDKNVYRHLLQKSYFVNVYSRYSQNEEIPVFSGYIDLNSVSSQIAELPLECESEPTPDSYVRFKLINSKELLTNKLININYQKPVSISQIIQDCSDLIGIDNVIVTTELPEKVYTNFKALGKPHRIIYEICASLGIRVNMQDGVLYIGSPNEALSSFNVLELNNINSSEPEYQTANEILLITDFYPQICPNDFVKCDFRELQGLYPVIKVSSVGDTYSRVCNTKIKIGI